jgi:hypothetical protein
LSRTVLLSVRPRRSGWYNELPISGGIAMRITRLLVALLVSLPGFAANAAEPASDTLRWRCVYEAVPAPGVACRLVHSPATDASAAAFPEISDLRPLMTRIRNAPETLVDERIVIPLYAPPVDMRFVARLARAVMCGSRADCAVEFSSDPADD